MKTILFQLTIFFSVLPFVNSYFNTSVRLAPSPCSQGSIFNNTHDENKCNIAHCFVVKTGDGRWKMEDRRQKTEDSHECSAHDRGDSCLRSSVFGLCSKNKCFFTNNDIISTPDFGAEMGQYVKTNYLPASDYAIKIVVIDPGHGGRDGGTSGQYAVEKDIALNIALRLGSSIQGNYPNIRVIYTRTSDVFVKLDERSRIANRNKADLFISIHCNYLEDGGGVKGSETYVMGLHKATENLNVAKRENSSILYEQNYEQTYGGYDPNSPEGHIILSMYQNAYLDQSIQLADKIESNIANFAQKRSRGVKQAGFVVLKQTTMPSVLVETGYLSNKEDERFLSTDNGQSEMAISILKAFVEYKNEVENNQSTSNTNFQQSKVSQQPVAKTTHAYQPAQQTNIRKGMNPSLSVNSAEGLMDGRLHYKVLLKSSQRLIDTSKSLWKNVSYSIQVVQESGMYKYLVIGFKNFEEAVSAKNKLRKEGFEEAFVVAYRGGKRVALP